MLHAGEPFRYALTQPIATAEVAMPDGTKQTLTPGNAREIVFGDTGRQGIYHLKAGTNETAFCVNVLDVSESNTKPREELQLGKFNTIVSTDTKRANVEIWRWLAVVALGVLMFEWWYYHRRTA